MQTAMRNASASADIIRRRIAELNQRNEALKPFADAFAEAAAAKLSGLAGVKVEVTVESALQHCLTTARAAEEGLDIVMARVTVPCWHAAGGDFDGFVCEAFLGGPCGEAAPGPERLMTRLSRKLRGYVLETLADAAGAALARLSGTEGHDIVYRARTMEKAGAPVLRSYQVSLVLRALDTSAEVTFQFDLASCMKAVAGVRPDGECATVAPMIGAASFAAEVLLPPERMPIGRIMGLSVGDVVHLTSTPDSEVTLRLNGRDIAGATLGFGDDRLLLRLVAVDAAIPEAAPARSLKLVGHDGQ